MLSVDFGPQQTEKYCALAAGGCPGQLICFRGGYRMGAGSGRIVEGLAATVERGLEQPAGETGADEGERLVGEVGQFFQLRAQMVQEKTVPRVVVVVAGRFRQGERAMRVGFVSRHAVSVEGE